MAARGPNRSLTARQRRFVSYYVIDPNATTAALRAGYSPKTAGVIGGQLFKKPWIVAAIEEGLAKVTTKLEITAERIVLEYARLALADYASLYDAEGELIPVHQLPEDIRRAIQEVIVTDTKKGERVRYKLHDKKGALDSLAERLWPATQRTMNLNLNVPMTQEKLREFTLEQLRVLLNGDHSTDHPA